MTATSIPLNEGWYQDDELELLAKAAAEAPPHPFLEIGVYKGRSASVLSRFTERLILCDNLSMGDFRTSWPPAWRAVGDVREASHLSPVFGLVHQDAGHDYETVREHLCLLMPKIVPHGFLCLHDYKDPTYPGVEQGFFVAEHDSHTLWTPWNRVGHLQVFRSE